MPFDVKRKFFAPCGHFYGFDFHPTEPWLLAGAHGGDVNIYSLESGTITRTYNVSSFSLFCVKFIARKDWFITAASNCQVHVVNYNSHQQVVAFWAHYDFISCIIVHPTASLVFTASDDKTIKAWDWDNQWENSQTYQGDAMIKHITFNPKDSNTFASASRDGVVTLWSIASPTPIATIEAHDKCVNYVKFYPGDKPYLVTASNDNTVKVWDYLSNSCVRTMEGHTAGVSFAIFHPNLPTIISGGLDGTVKIWNSETHRNERTLRYNPRWPLGIVLRRDTNEVALGFTHGLLTLELDYHRPKISIDHSGKFIYIRAHKVFSSDLKTLDTITTTPSSSDGAQISLQTKDLGSSEILASSLLHTLDGHLVTVVGDDEYTVYTALGWHNKSFGTGISFAWATDSNTYAVLETRVRWKIYKNFQEVTDGSFYYCRDYWKHEVDALYTGPVLSAIGPGFVTFWEWETGKLVRRIDVGALNIYWNTAGTHVAITSPDTLYIFYFDRDVYDEQEQSVWYGDVPESMTLLFTLHDIIQSATWFEDGLIYITPTQLSSLVGPTNHSPRKSTSAAPGQEQKQVYAISSLADHNLSLLAYIPAHERVYVIDEDMKVYGFGLSSAVVELQMAVWRGDRDGTKDLLRRVPKEQVGKVAKFLVDRGMKELARSITTAPGCKFEPTLSLDHLTITSNTTLSSPSRPVTASQAQKTHQDEADLDPYQRCITLAMELIAIKATNKLISELRDDKAQDLVDFLSKIIDDNLTQYQRKHTIRLLSKLAKSAEVFPKSLELEGIQCNLAKPVTWGGYGLIFKGEHEGSPICIKAVHVELEENNRKKLRAHASELIIWAHLLHLNVLPFLGIYPSEEEASRVCIVSPWMNNGDLLQYLRKVPDVPRKPLVRDIISGLQYLHDFDIIHADLKAKNVLVSESGRAMLADFGISRLSITQTTILTNAGVGTANWMAPELLLEDEPPSPNRQTDIWAFACTCHEIITGTTPFSQYRNAPQLMGAFMRGKIVPLKPQEPGIGWDEDVWSIATRCWQSNPTSRPNAHELFRMMNDFHFRDDRSSDPESRRKRNYTEIDYDHVFGILDGICQLGVV